MAFRPDPLVCFSHLRWDFVYQRPQHLLSRAARDREVLFIEEPIFEADIVPTMTTTKTPEGVTVVVPRLPTSMTASQAEAAQRRMLDRLVAGLSERPVLWYYTPMAVAWSRHVDARAVVYDCMDELSLFLGAPRELCEREAQLFAMADVVFTGGHSLYRHKCKTQQHDNIHPFPSSVDVAHFAQARHDLVEPQDQASIEGRRVGFFGVIDERLDIPLLAGLADLRPDLQIVMIGPVVKIDPATLPRRPNIHYLGGRKYEQLPAYLAGWDVALLLFARNEATRFISPTKTPEYLAAGRPVVSTSIADVVDPYGRSGLAWIADAPGEMAAAIDEAMASDPVARRAHADAVLAEMSWDRTFAAMWRLVEEAAANKAARFLSQRSLTPVSAGGAAAARNAGPAED